MARVFPYRTREKNENYIDLLSEERKSFADATMKTTEEGKVMNPTDAYEKELRKKKLKRESSSSSPDPYLAFLSHLGVPRRRITAEEEERVKRSQPEDSVYYDHVLNPFGMLPAGKPPMHKKSMGFAGPRIPLPDSGELASANDDTTLPPSLPLPTLPPAVQMSATDSGQPFLLPQPSGSLPPKESPTLTARAALFSLPPQTPGPPPPKEPPALTAHATLFHLPPPPKSTQLSPPGMGKSEREKVHGASSNIQNPESNLAAAVQPPPSPSPPHPPPMLANHRQLGGALSQSTGANDASKKTQTTLPSVGLPNRSFKPPPPQKTTLQSRTTPSSSHPTKTVITSLSAEWRKIDMEAVRSTLIMAKRHMNGFIANSQGRDRAIEDLVERIRMRLLMYEFPTDEVDAFFEEWREHMATFERLSVRGEAIAVEERARRLKEVKKQATKAQSERDTHFQRREYYKEIWRVTADKLKAAEDCVSKLEQQLKEARKTVVTYRLAVDDLEQETSTANSKLEVAEKSVADTTSKLKLMADSEPRAIHQQRLEEVKIDILFCIQAFFESVWVKSFMQA